MKEPFDAKLASECAHAFSASCQVGCLVSDADGNIKDRAGYSCADCRICAAAGRSPDDCLQYQKYGMTEAERFGGKYIYFCPMGLTCFVSPILGSEGAEAKITVGPFLMVDTQDYVTCDLEDRLGYSIETLDRLQEVLQDVPYIPAEKVEAMSLLLFMAVGFMNNISSANRMLETQGSENIQGQITSYIQQLKEDCEEERYPLDTEQALLRAVRQSNKPEANRLLNELLGHILLWSAGDFERCRAQIYELLVLISRTTVSAGAYPRQTLKDSHRYFTEISRLQDFDALCLWLAKEMGRLMDNIFDYSEMRHANMVHQTIQYINEHYQEKITLESLSYQVYLSPTYLSRVFKEEIGETVTSYINRIRIDRSRELLRKKSLSVADIAQMVGFEDQSYFTRVFKKQIGKSPLKYREQCRE